MGRGKSIKPIKEHRLTVRLDDETFAQLKDLEKEISTHDLHGKCSAAIRWAIREMHAARRK